MASKPSLQEALAILQNSSARDDELRQRMASDCKSIEEIVSKRLVKPAETALQLAASDAMQAHVEVRKTTDEAMEHVRGETCSAFNAPYSNHESINLTCRAKFEKFLGKLPDGASVAVISMLGSLCPITLGHVQCYIEARRIILDDCEKRAPRPAHLEHFQDCLGLVRLNGDGYVSSKLAQKGQETINREDRSHLVNLATADYPWLCLDNGFSMLMRKLWPRFQFTVFDMNGADDVVKYQKWSQAGPSNRMITMGRHGSTAAVMAGMKASKVNPDDGNCFLGPELPDISSTEARRAISLGNRQKALTMLHPSVADWMLSRHVHARPSSGNSSGSIPNMLVSNSQSVTTLRPSSLQAVGAEVLKHPASTTRKSVDASKQPKRITRASGSASRDR